MKNIRKLLPPVALVSALALVPVTASSFAAADTTNYQELEKFMAVYQQVKQNYVVPVDDHALLKGAIDGMLSSIVPRGRDKPFDVTIVREEIKLRPVKWEIKDGIGIININQFANGTGEATEAAITAIDKATGGKTLGYIIDLRSNPGGSLDEAIQVSDAFLESGEVVSQRGRDKDDIQRYYAKPGDMTHGLPVIVLTDVGSAS